MATYVYETIPEKKGAQPKRFEIQQSMNDDALTNHPETGEPVRRIISGGYGVMIRGSASSGPSDCQVPTGMCCGGSCGPDCD